MNEQKLQKKIVDIVQDHQLLDFICNKKVLDEALLIDNDAHFIPEFSIDYLLKKRFSESGKRVLNGLSNYELITGDSIKNISLQKKEQLFPDLVLYNPIQNQIILIENKTSKQTEREAITELLGYTAEIRNHLPFISNDDIHYLLIATEFSTLLNHSVASQLLSDHINILCLKPMVEEQSIVGLSIHFPDAWTDIGQAGIPANGLIGCTLTLHKKDEKGFAHPPSFDEEDVINLAADMINHQANNYRSGGFVLVWENSDNKLLNCTIGITIYMLNPYVFLPAAVDMGFSLNTHSALFQRLLQQQEKSRGAVFSSSLLETARKAGQYLGLYYDVEYQSGGDWNQDLKNSDYTLKRRPVLFRSFGVIGDFIRYFYLHPAARKFMFFDSELHNEGFNKPLIGLQIVNYITNNAIFKQGRFYCKDLFLFGKMISTHLHAQYNALMGDARNISSQEAYLFWTALPLLQASKEIQLRLRDARNLPYSDTPFPLVLKKEIVRENFKEQSSRFIQWLLETFIDAKANPLIANLFVLGYNCADYFNPLLKKFLSQGELLDREKQLGDFSRKYIKLIVLQVLENNGSNNQLIEKLSKIYFNDALLQLKPKQMNGVLKKMPDNVYAATIDQLLDILNEAIGELVHELRDYQFLPSIDWQFYYTSAQKRWVEGERLTAIVVYPNGEFALGRLLQPNDMQLKDSSEVFLQYSTDCSGIVTTIIIQWQSLLDGTFKFPGI